MMNFIEHRRHNTHKELIVTGLIAVFSSILIYGVLDHWNLPSRLRDAVLSLGPTPSPYEEGGVVLDKDHDGLGFVYYFEPAGTESENVPVGDCEDESPEHVPTPYIWDAQTHSCIRDPIRVKEWCEADGVGIRDGLLTVAQDRDGDGAVSIDTEMEIPCENDIPDGYLVAADHPYDEDDNRVDPSVYTRDVGPTEKVLVEEKTVCVYLGSNFQYHAKFVYVVGQGPSIDWSIQAEEIPVSSFRKIYDQNGSAEYGCFDTEQWKAGHYEFTLIGNEFGNSVPVVDVTAVEAEWLGTLGFLCGDPLKNDSRDFCSIQTTPSWVVNKGSTTSGINGVVSEVKIHESDAVVPAVLIGVDVLPNGTVLPGGDAVYPRE